MEPGGPLTGSSGDQFGVHDAQPLPIVLTGNQIADYEPRRNWLCDAPIRAPILRFCACRVVGQTPSLRMSG
jgi:hypothetical protein